MIFFSSRVRLTFALSTHVIAPLNGTPRANPARDTPVSGKGVLNEVTGTRSWESNSVD